MNYLTHDIPANDLNIINIEYLVTSHNGVNKIALLTEKEEKSKRLNSIKEYVENYIKREHYFLGEIENNQEALQKLQILRNKNSSLFAVIVITLKENPDDLNRRIENWADLLDDPNSQFTNKVDTKELADKVDEYNNCTSVKEMENIENDLEEIKKQDEDAYTLAHLLSGVSYSREYIKKCLDLRYAYISFNLKYQDTIDRVTALEKAIFSMPETAIANQESSTPHTGAKNFPNNKEPYNKEEIAQTSTTTDPSSSAIAESDSANQGIYTEVSSNESATRDDSVMDKAEINIEEDMEKLIQVAIKKCTSKKLNQANREKLRGFKEKYTDELCQSVIKSVKGLLERYENDNSIPPKELERLKIKYVSEIKKQTA